MKIRQNTIRIFAILSLLSVFASCSLQEGIGGQSLITKRKYRPGYFVQLSGRASQAHQKQEHSRQLISNQLFDSALSSSAMRSPPAAEALSLEADAAPALPQASAPKDDAPTPPATLRLPNKISRAEFRQILREQRVENQKEVATRGGGEYIVYVLFWVLLTLLIAALIAGFILFGSIGILYGILAWGALIGIGYLILLF